MTQHEGHSVPNNRQLTCWSISTNDFDFKPFVWIIHQWTLVCPDKRPAMWNAFPYHDVILTDINPVTTKMGKLYTNTKP